MPGLAPERMPDWPAAMPREMALAYTGVAEEMLRKWERARKVRFAAAGPHGRKIVPRAQLDAALAELFGTPASDLSEDLDFG